ncbi:MAG: RecQ family ATP-dependent DNA helicase [Pirellulaceae bacterium]
MAAEATADINELLRERFGLQSFRAGQRAVIERLLDGKSAAAIFPTGGGKSLCYQLPAIVLDGLTLVVSPLMALMREQVDQLVGRGIAAGRLDSSLTADESRHVMQSVRTGELKLLYVAPERFFNERFREFIQGVPISLFAIDEAHCISQWGHNFRPDYLKLAIMAKELNAERILALTATATPAVLDDIKRAFAIDTQDAVLTPFYRSNLTLRFTLTNEAERDELLLERLQANPVQPTLIYVTLQKTAEQIAAFLTESGVPAQAYHAGLDAEIRRQVQDWFMQSNDGIVVATIAFGMGIDKANIRAIYHYNPSKSLESLAQEIGRAGRDGEPAVCETLLVPEDRVTLENFAYGDTPSLSSIRRFVEILVGQPNNFFISYYSLAYEADMRDSVVRTLLTNMELDGTLIATAPRYETYKYKPRVTSQQILKHFEGERRQFASAVLAMSVKKKIWFEISLIQAAERLKCDRTRIVKMLDYFAEKGWIELEASGLVHGYRKLQPITDIEALSQQLYQVTLDREIGELSRIDEMMAIACHTQCQSRALSEHFGQSLEMDCGHCSACEGNGIGELPEPNYPRIGDSALSAIRKLSKEKPDLLGEARQQARFLCGLSSPKMIRARLTQHPMYACCNHIPFDQVMDALIQ